MGPLWEHGVDAVSIGNDDKGAPGARVRQNEETSASSIIERMKEVSNCASDAELSKMFNVSRSNISKWRKRNSVPYEQVQRIAVLSNGNLSYILTGKKSGTEFRTLSVIDVNTLKLVLRAIYFPTMLVMPPGQQNVNDYIDRLAKSISRRYNEIENAAADIMKATGLDEHRARAVAMKAAASILLGSFDDRDK
jgi:hypothetical protein